MFTETHKIYTELLPAGDGGTADGSKAVYVCLDGVAGGLYGICNLYKCI